MFPIEKLLGVLLTTDPPRELESADPRLEEAVAATTRGDYRHAAQVAQQLYADGVFDARLLGYLLYAELQSRGSAVLELLLRAAHQSLTLNLSAFTPLQRRDVHLDAALHWCLNKIVRQIELSDRLPDGLNWEEAAERGELAGALAAAGALQPLLDTLTSRARAPQSLQRLCDVLQKMQQRAEEQNQERSRQTAADEKKGTRAPVAEQPGRSAAFAPVAPEPIPETTPAAVSTVALPEEVASAPAVLLPGFVSPDTIRASPALHQLALRIQLFTRLIEQQAVTHAAVVAEELQRALDRFDPRVYIPTLLAPYLSTLADSSEDLEPILQQRDQLRFRALTQLYRADPDAFAAHAEESCRPTARTPTRARGQESSSEDDDETEGR